MVAETGTAAGLIGGQARSGPSIQIRRPLTHVVRGLEWAADFGQNPLAHGQDGPEGQPLRRIVRHRRWARDHRLAEGLARKRRMSISKLLPVRWLAGGRRPKPCMPLFLKPSRPEHGSQRRHRDEQLPAPSTSARAIDRVWMAMRSPTRKASSARSSAGRCRRARARVPASRQLMSRRSRPALVLASTSPWPSLRQRSACSSAPGRTDGRPDIREQRRDSDAVVPGHRRRRVPALAPKDSRAPPGRRWRSRSHASTTRLPP